MDTGVGHQVGLELSKIDVEGTIEAEGGGDGADDLPNKAVQIGVCRSLNVQVTATDVVNCLKCNEIT